MHVCSCTVLLALGLSAAGALGQNAPVNEQGGNNKGYTLRQSVEEVLLYCTVTDKKDHLITGLDQAAFKVQQDGHPVSIAHFSNQDTPVSLSLVLDDSDSMKQQHATMENGARDLSQAAKAGDEISVTNFADEAYVDQALTEDGAAIRHALQSSQSVSGGTALFDTLIGAADRLRENAHHSKRVIVVFTDGRDNSSGADLHKAVQEVQYADGPVIYVVGMLYGLPGSDARRARKDLSALADETGGVALFPANPAQVQESAAEVARDIHSQYMIAFHPLPNTRANTYHTIAVRASAAGHGSLQVRTRKGFLRRVSAAS